MWNIYQERGFSGWLLFISLMEIPVSLSSLPLFPVFLLCHISHLSMHCICHCLWKVSLQHFPSVFSMEKLAYHTLWQIWMPSVVLLWYVVGIRCQWGGGGSGGGVPEVAVHQAEAETSQVEIQHKFTHEIISIAGFGSVQFQCNHFKI